jgi:hypothetical protein
VYIVVNHLHLRDPLRDETVAAAAEALRRVVDAGAVSARIVRVDERHLILLLEVETLEDAARIARDVGGPWMREHMTPLLDGETERSVGEVIVSAQASRDSA